MRGVLKFTSLMYSLDTVSAHPNVGFIMNCTSVFDQFARAIVNKSKGFTLNPVLYFCEQVGQIVTL